MKQTRVLTLLLSVFLIVLALQPYTEVAHAAPVTVTFQQGLSPTGYTGAADNYFRQQDPRDNYGGATDLRVQSDSSGSPDDNRRTILKFDMSGTGGIPTGATITSATLSLYEYQRESSRTYWAYRITQTDWVEGTATGSTQSGSSDWTYRVDSTLSWTNAGGTFTTTDGASTTVPSTNNNWMNWAVTAQVQYAVNNVGRVAHFLIKDETESNSNGYQTSFRSKEYTSDTSLRPKLVVTYTLPISKIVFTTSPQTLTADVPSAVMTIQTQDSSNNPVNVASSTTISLTSTPGTGKFSLLASPWIDIPAVTITAGSNSASFYYKDTTAGTPTITAAENPSQGWTDATQQETVNKASPTILTTLSSTSIPAGGSVYDTATLSGATSNAGGTVTYSYYSDGSCSVGGTQVGTPVTVTNGVVPDSASQPFNSPGSFSWNAVYSGDANNNGPVTSSCEPLTVNAVTGTIVVQKVAVGGDATFNFTATGSGISSPFSITTVSGSGSQSFSGLAAGAYSVTESGPSLPWLFTSLVCPDGVVVGQTVSISLAAGQTVTCTYTDTKTGTIVVNKSAVGGDAQFNFTATGLSSPFSITTVGGSGTSTFSGLAAGAYSVTESGPSLPWLFTSLVCPDGVVAGQTVSISLAAGQTVTCTYTDTKAAEIIINKSAVNGDATFNFTATGDGLPGSFSITTASGSGSQSFSGLAAGAYSVTESGPSLPWLFTSLVCPDGVVVGQAVSISLTAGQTVTCTFTDTKVATIVINKSAVGGDAQFNFTATGGLATPFSITTTGGSGSSTFSNLAPGAYSVTESGPSLPWVFTSLSCSAGGSVVGQTATISLTAGSTVTCTYTDAKAAEIVINKSAVGGDAQFNFTATGGLATPFSITTTGGSGSSTFSNLAPGAYSVTESGPSLPWVFTSLSCSAGGSVVGQTATITLAAGQTVTCTYTDNKAGTIVVNKSGVGGDAQFNFTATGTGLPASFSITTVSGSGSQTFSNLIPGSYSVTEVGPSSPWSFTSLSCPDGVVVGQTATITLAWGQTVTCSYTDAHGGTIIINKSAVGGDAKFNFTSTGGNALPASFSITTTGGSGSSTFNGLVPGPYSVTESGPSSPWLFTGLSCSAGGSVSGQTATISSLAAGQTVTCTYTDTKAGTIVIQKSAVGGDAKFNFTATGLTSPFSITTVSGSGSQTFSGLAPGTYSVTESGPSLPWSFTSLVCPDGSVVGQAVSISLTAGQTVTCTYTDTRVASIVINKSAVGGNAQFNFTATGTGLPASFSITTVSGSGSSTFSNLVPGAYSVTESGPSLPWSFTSLSCSSGGSVSGQTVTISSLAAGQTVTCTYTDTKATTGTIVIQKSAIGGNAKFNFTATGTGLPASFSITTAFGGSNSSTFNGLVPGAYTVVESGPSSPWSFTSLTCSAGTVVGQSVTGILAAGQTVTCTYTDTKTVVLSVSVNPAGSGTVNLSPSQPTGGYIGGTVVQASPQASSDYYFIGWALDGGYAGMTNPLSVTMDDNHALTAYFQSQATLWPKYVNPTYGYSIGPTTGHWDANAAYGGRPFTINDTNKPSWLSTFCNSQPCKFGLIYTGDTAPSGVGRAIGLAVSIDGYTWYKYSSQILQVGTSGSWDSLRVANGQVIWDGTQYVMYYTGRSATTGVDAVGRATSTDLITWVRDPSNPVLVGVPGESTGPVHPLVIKTGPNAYKMWYTAPHPETGISYVYLASSISGAAGSWVRENSGQPVFSPSTDPSAWDSSLVYFEAVIYNTDGTYTMFYSGCALPAEGTICRIGYAISPDGISWSRPSDNPIVAQAPANSPYPASWDVYPIKDPGVAVFNGRIMIYYTGDDYAIGIAMQPVGTIVINKIAVAGNAQFNFTSTGGNALPASFSITTTSGTGTQIFNNIASGTYSVSESGPSLPWSFTSLSCSAGGSVGGQTATISLTAGSTVTCTYTDTRVASIVINKSAVGGDATFNFTATGLSSPFSITTVGGSGSQTFSNLAPGAYSVTESGPSSPWVFTTLTCSSGGSVSGQTATISSLATGQTVTCTFTDTKAVYVLTVNVSPGGSGSVAKVPDQASYHLGDSVQLTANPADGWSFSEWSGDISGSVSPRSIIINGTTSVTANFIATYGLLRVTSNPAVPTTIFVNNFPRDDWGFNWVKLAPGTYTVHFTDVPGFATPANQTVVVTAGQTTTVQGTFTQLGYLHVQTNPAVMATISIDGKPRDDWGAWLPMTPGLHTVHFGDVADYTTPGDQQVTVFAGQTVTAIGNYVPGVNPGPSGFGLLRVETSPAVVSSVYVNNVLMDDWGLNWVKLAPGTYTIHFTDVPGFASPANQTVTVTAGQTTTVTGNFQQLGYLHVTTNPAVAGTIYVDGTAMDDWGVWVALEPGTYTVSFGDVQGKVTPAPQPNVIVTAGQTTPVTGDYT